MRILITSIGGTLVPLLIKYLKKDKQLKNIFIIGVDKRNIKKKYFLLDKFYKLPESSSKNYIRKILKISIEEKIDLIIPHSDNESL